MTSLVFEDIDNNIIKVESTDIRHIEETSNNYGLDIFILHFHSQGEEIEVLHNNHNIRQVGNLLQY